jgi:hypothetical protein
MCPFCLSTAMLIAGSVTITGGLATLAIKKFGAKHVPDTELSATPADISHDET